uniref:Rab-GAP TBC domain-containing protein n=1 Tax=Mucochytrium quahogii TaxID=96639 RepID=A0A7S2RQH3_9STRA|mmetsp:Transcript_4250/g.6250  ORF Transcript_4250/g.6250 Transcript_4250/m.6250 type:complete len:369 (+) Transcript_4250:146-1252(+)
MEARVRLWENELLPGWKASRSKWGFEARVEKECFRGIPAVIRTKAWPLLIGNRLRITSDLFEILRATAEEARYVTELQDGYDTMHSESESEHECASPNNNFDVYVQDENASLPNAPSVCFVQEQVIENGNSEMPSRKKLLKRKTSLSSQIEIDLSRTFPKLAFFEEGGGPFRQSLQDILEAYSQFRPQLGYVQGMSHVAAVLLLFLDRDPAFAGFCNILHDHVFFGLIREKQGVTLRKHLSLFQYLLKEHVPMVSTHFEEISLLPEMYLIDWLLTILSKALPLDIVARIWDCYLYYDRREKRERFLWRAILGLLKLFSVQLKLLDFDSALSLLRKIPEKLDTRQYFECIQGISITHRRYTTLRAKVGL